MLLSEQMLFLFFFSCQLCPSQELMVQVECLLLCYFYVWLLGSLLVCVLVAACQLVATFCWTISNFPHLVNRFTPRAPCMW